MPQCPPGIHFSVAPVLSTMVNETTIFSYIILAVCPAKVLLGQSGHLRHGDWSTKIWSMQTAKLEKCQIIGKLSSINASTHLISALFTSQLSSSAYGFQGESPWSIKVLIRNADVIILFSIQQCKRVIIICYGQLRCHACSEPDKNNLAASTHILLITMRDSFFNNPFIDVVLWLGCCRRRRNHQSSAFFSNPMSRILLYFPRERKHRKSHRNSVSFQENLYLTRTNKVLMLCKYVRTSQPLIYFGK